MYFKDHFNMYFEQNFTICALSCTLPHWLKFKPGHNLLEQSDTDRKPFAANCVCMYSIKCNFGQIKVKTNCQDFTLLLLCIKVKKVFNGEWTKWSVWLFQVCKRWLPTYAMKTVIGTIFNNVFCLVQRTVCLKDQQILVVC